MIMPLSVYHAPGIYMEEIPSGARPIQAVGTSTAAFVGVAPNRNAYKNEVRAINNWSQFLKEFVGEQDTSTPLSHAVYGFFLNGGGRCYVLNIGKDGSLTGAGRTRTGLALLESYDDVAILGIPGYTDAASWGAALDHCEKLKDRVAVLDAPESVKDLGMLTKVATAEPAKKPPAAEGAAAPSEGARARVSDRGYGAFYYPWVVVRDPLSGENVTIPPSGHVAGIYARVDSMRGVHKAPANETVLGALNLNYWMTNEEQGELNDNGVNCIRFFPREGIRVWGARTLAADAQWRYLNVRRLFNMIEKSIVLSTRWVVFEPNDESLWKSIRRDIKAFLTLVWRDGALMGATPEEAFFVKCDAETNPREVVDAGQVVIYIGIAPVKPAEFVIFRIGQTASGAQTETL
jgi:phage tail sheath protein FI